MPAIGAGTLRHWVQLERPEILQNPVTGEQVTSWAGVAQLWADIHASSGNEFFAAGAEQSEVRNRITIRHFEPVDATMRIVHAGKYYAIFAVLPDADSMREHLTLMCGEGVRLDL